MSSTPDHMKEMLSEAFEGRWHYYEEHTREGRVKAKIIRYRIAPEDKRYPIIAVCGFEESAVQIVEDHNDMLKERGNDVHM